jgi:hypothetical protein
LPEESATEVVSVGVIWPIPKPAGDCMTFWPVAFRPSVEFAFIDALFNEELLIDELFIVVWAEALKARAKNMTSKTAAAFFAFIISIDSST